MDEDGNIAVDVQHSRQSMSDSVPSEGNWYRCVKSTARKVDEHIYSVAGDGEFVYIGSESRRVRVWKHPDLIEVGSLKSGSGMVKALMAVGDNIFTAHHDHKIRIWQLRGGAYNNAFSCRRLATLPMTFKDKLGRQKHTDVISSLAYNREEGLLYSGSWDKTVKAWRLCDFKCIDSIAAHDDAINCVAVARDGSLFTASADSTIKVWRKVPGEDGHTLTMTLRFQRSPINALAVSGDGLFLYSGSSDGIVNYWTKEMGSGRFHHAGFLRGHRLGVSCLATAEERMIFSGSEDTTIRVWKREVGHAHSCLAVLQGHSGPVMCVSAATMEGHAQSHQDHPSCLLYSGGLDRTVKVWLFSHPPPPPPPDVDLEHVDRDDYGVVPVLSPSWVQTKLNIIDKSHPRF